ncbi:MAG: hypothetical protein ABL888_07870 [Pirellulaceae bacterium]
MFCKAEQAGPRSEDFLHAMLALIERPAVKRNTLQLVAEQRELPGFSYRFRSKTRTARADSATSRPGRNMAAWLCREWTSATLSERSPHFGLGGVDNVSNLVRRGREKVQRVAKMAASRNADRMRAESEHTI